MTGLYVLGVDFGTESGRVVLVEVSTGKVKDSHVTAYPHGVLTETLPGGTPLPGKETVLQVPGDYLFVLKESIPEIMERNGLDGSRIIGIGLDFTSCTMLPVSKDFIPLCELEPFRERPHAYAKLWKHHEAESQAKRLNELAQQQPWLARYGGTISAEWMIPKIMEIVENDPDVYDQAELFLEAGDWVVSRLTGNLARSSCSAGYKGMWHKKDGYVDSRFLKKLHPKFERLYDTKLRGNVHSIGEKAGELSQEMAEMLGLAPGTAVAVSVIDAHAALPGAGVYEPGNLVMVVGTSTCHLLLSEREEMVPGISGVVEDGILPGFYAYEAGQAAVGDLFAWFIHHQVPDYVKKEAEQQNISVHDVLMKEASTLSPGESGLIALDWHNGSRTPWVDMSLSGVIVGQKLSTRPAEMYRACLEATAFGTRVIVELFEKQGISVDAIVATGGIPNKNPLLMQIYADVLQRNIVVIENEQTPALGAAMFGAAAAGRERGGYDSVEEAISQMAPMETVTYYPNKQHKRVYDKLFGMYEQLSVFFAKETGIMHELAELGKNRQSEGVI